MANPQNIKKGDMVYIKKNIGPHWFDWTVGKTGEVVSDPGPTLTMTHDIIQDAALVDIGDLPPIYAQFSGRYIVCHLSELVKINNPDKKLDIIVEKELELV